MATDPLKRDRVAGTEGIEERIALTEKGGVEREIL
jgi:hypothetical protein